MLSINSRSCKRSWFISSKRSRFVFLLPSRTGLQAGQKYWLFPRGMKAIPQTQRRFLFDFFIIVHPVSRKSSDRSIYPRPLTASSAGHTSGNAAETANPLFSAIGASWLKPCRAKGQPGRREPVRGPPPVFCRQVCHTSADVEAGKHVGE